MPSPVPCLTSSLAANSVRVENGASVLKPVLRYLAAVTLANLAWELAQIPLYTIWREGSPGEILFAIGHCTLGDALIAAASLELAIAVAGGRRWIDERSRVRRVAITTVVIAVVYTVFSEWWNVSIRGTWAYSAWMPKVLGIGLTPLLQWVATPAVGLWFIGRRPSTV
jgi:hypothetical protein